MKNHIPFESGQIVESKSFIKGFRGAWFRGKMKNIRTRRGSRECLLEYCDFPDEKTTWTNFYGVSPKDPGELSDLKQRKRELMFRPSFPPFHKESEPPPLHLPGEVKVVVNDTWRVGDLVDLWCDECFWSGKIIKLDAVDLVESDHVDVRVEAVWLIGEFVSLSKFRLGKDYPMIFVEFLERFSDESMQVRIAAVECVRSCIFSDPSGGEESIVLKAIEGRLLDAEDKVRIQAFCTVCDLAKLSIQSFPSEVVLRATERLRDRKISVRKNILHSLLDLYRFYCDECSKGIIVINSCYEQIPCNVLLLCFDKDTDAFRPTFLELLFARDLFPPSLSAEERARHWIAFYSLFIQPHIKAFSTILSQKKWLHLEMQAYLAFQLQAKDHLLEEARNKILSCFTKMSCYFPDAPKAVELFHSLHRMKDKNIFKDLQDLCNESSTLVSAKSTRDSFLKRIGSKHQSDSFFKALSWKCSHSLLNYEIVQCIVEQLQKCIRNRETKDADSIFELLLAVSATFPSFLKQSEVYLVDIFKLISDEANMTSDKCLLLLAKSCCHLSIKLRQ